MAVPRNRVSNARKNSRRSHHAKKPKIGFDCKNCGVMNLPHTMCISCGHYDGKQVVQKAE